MTTYKLVDEKRFKLAFRPTDGNKSDTVRHGGLQWVLTVDEKSGKLSCTSESRKQWSVDTKVIFRIKDLIEGLNDSATFYVTFNGSNPEITWESDSFKNDGKIIESIIEIRSTIGLPITRDFTIYDKKLSDMTLIVNGYKLYVNKGVLASVSPVFYSMFYTNFKEVNAKQVVLYDVDYHDFLVILRILHDRLPLITAYNIDDILKIADQFDINPIINECESFIITTDSLTLTDKIRLADKYRMKDVMTHLIESIDNMSKIKNLDDVGCDTVKQLVDKAMILEEEKEVDNTSSSSPSSHTLRSPTASTSSRSAESSEVELPLPRFDLFQNMIE